MRTIPTLLAALCIATATAPLTAQLPERAPATPDSVLTPGPGDAPFIEWRADVRSHGRFGAAFLLRGARYQVLVVTPMALDVLSADSLVVRHARGCRDALQLSDSLIESAAGMRVWEDFDSATVARPVVAFTVLPADPVRMECTRSELTRFAAMARGAVFGVPARYNPVFDAVTAELRRDGELQEAHLLGSAPVRKYVVGQAVEDDTRQVRLYVSPEVFAPYDDGRPSSLSLFVWSPEEEAPDILPMPPELSRAVWAQFQPWRARRLGADGRAPLEQLRLEFPVPRDTGLQRAHAQFAAGEWGRSTATTLSRLAWLPHPSRRETRNAMLQAAATFVAYGNDEDATSLLKDVVEYYPCLTMTAGAPEEMHAIIERARPAARCTSVPLWKVLGASIVPGGGQATTAARRSFGTSLLLGTVGAYALAQGAHAYSRSQYDAYLKNEFTTSVPPTADYQRAENARKFGNALLIGAAATWAFAAAEAVFYEYRHDRRLKEMRNLGAPRSRRLGLAPAPQGAGIALEWR